MWPFFLGHKYPWFQIIIRSIIVNLQSNRTPTQLHNRSRLSPLPFYILSTFSLHFSNYFLSTSSLFLFTPFFSLLFHFTVLLCFLSIFSLSIFLTLSIHFYQISFSTFSLLWSLHSQFTLSFHFLSSLSLHVLYPNIEWESRYRKYCQNVDGKVFLKVRKKQSEKIERENRG